MSSFNYISWFVLFVVDAQGFFVRIEIHHMIATTACMMVQEIFSLLSLRYWSRMPRSLTLFMINSKRWRDEKEQIQLGCYDPSIVFAVERRNAQ